MTTLTWGVAGRVACAASLLIFLTVAAFTGPALAEEISLPATGQKYCYDFAGTKLKTCEGTGQDGEFQAGVPLPSPRFSVSFDGCALTDRLTRLIWAHNVKQICSSDWNDAINAVNALNYCNKTDWRAANVNELQSLANAGTTDLYSWLTNSGFTISPGLFFSSTSYINDDSVNPSAWGMDVRDGSQYGGLPFLKSNAYCVWPVRGNSDSSASARVAQTGQDVCYDASNAQLTTCNGSGQDAEWLAGASWPIPRYYVNLSPDDGVTPDGTITDLFTNLMWTTVANTAGPGDTTIDPVLCANDPTTGFGTPKSWQEALHFVKVCLNSATDPWLGYRDWRLPNKNELASLIDRSVAPSTPALEADQPFQNVIVDGVYPQAAGHWSSTTSLRNPGGAKIVDMTFGDIITYSKGSGRLHVWPIRGNYPLLQVIIADAGGGGTGTVATSPEGVGCTTYCVPEACPSDLWPDGSQRYPEDKKVTLKAKAATNSVFTGWTVNPGVCEGKGSCAVTMVSDVTVTANFTSLATLSLTPATKKYSKTKTTKTASATFTVKDLTTLGKQPLAIDSIELAGANPDQFFINPVKDKCTGQTLSAGKSCTIQVVFAPTSAGVKTAILSVSSADDTDSPRTATLSGEGALP